MPKHVIPAGTKFTRLTVVGNAAPRAYKSGNARRFMECRCDCGTISIVNLNSLLSGNTKSCGCLRRELVSQQHFKHGHNLASLTSKTYQIWGSMIQRCVNSNCKHYDNYGGRGIMVCERWRKFEHFLADMGERPERLTLERVDNDLGYCPENCRWDTRKKQNRNRRDNRIYAVQGKTACLAELCEFFNVSYGRTEYRLRRGWPPELAFFAPKNSSYSTPTR